MLIRIYCTTILIHLCYIPFRYYHKQMTNIEKMVIYSCLFKFHYRKTGNFLSSDLYSDPLILYSSVIQEEYWFYSFITFYYKQFPFTNLIWIDELIKYISVVAPPGCRAHSLQILLPNNLHPWRHTFHSNQIIQFELSYVINDK